MTFRPAPVQRPRIPIWVVGAWPSERSMARAARWDGLVAQAMSKGGQLGPWGPEPFKDAVDWVLARRREEGRDGPYEFVVSADPTPADDPAAARLMVEPWRAAGATWWIEADWEGATVDAIRRRIVAGPPR
jgi:alkanesulfonate monooxygenase SsuD/methylene tetrahydromethanopterin reductase-like flavin-dependent oxidoreductase (luciferase family)